MGIDSLTSRRWVGTPCTCRAKLLTFSSPSQPPPASTAKKRALGAYYIYHCFHLSPCAPIAHEQGNPESGQRGSRAYLRSPSTTYTFRDPTARSVLSLTTHALEGDDSISCEGTERHRAGPRAADLSLIIPAYNEALRLPHSLDRLSAYTSETGLFVELVVVDDGSSDTTAQIAHHWETQTTNPRLKVRTLQISHRGKGAAVRAGMHVANAPIIGYCDADLSVALDALTTLYLVVERGTDMAIASRELEGSVLEVHQPWYRERAGRAFNTLLRALVDIPYRDTQCGLKLFRRDVANDLFSRQRLDGFAFDAEVVVLAVRQGYDIEEVAVRWTHVDGSKVSLARHSLPMLRDVARIGRHLRRGAVHTLGVPDAAALDRMTSSEGTHWWHVAKRALVEGCLESSSGPGRCLDVGCGGGALVSQTAIRRPAFGVDLSTQALAHGWSGGTRNLVRAEAGAVPFSSGSFAAALALDVLEHHPHPERLLAEISRLLEDEGTLIVTVPAFMWMWSYADHLLGHYRRYTKRSLCQELTRGGFVVSYVSYFHSWLLPVAWGFRQLRSLTGQTDSADDFPVPPLLNSILLEICHLESRLMKLTRLPFGLSLVAIARPERCKL